MCRYNHATHLHHASIEHRGGAGYAACSPQGRTQGRAADAQGLGSDEIPGGTRPASPVVCLSRLQGWSRMKRTGLSRSRLGGRDPHPERSWDA